MSSITPNNSLNSTISSMGESSGAMIASRWSNVPTPAEEQQWCNQLQQEAANNPALQKILNDNQNILNDLKTNNTNDLPLDFKSLASCADENSMTPQEQKGFAQGWVSVAYSDYLGSDDPHQYGIFTSSVASAVNALDKIQGNDPSILQAKGLMKEALAFLGPTPDPVASSNAWNKINEASQILSG